MSNMKERILGAVTIMSEKEAEKVWELIQGTFCLSNAEEDIPDDEESKIMKAYKSGDPDYQPSITQEELIKEFGL